MYYLLTVNVLTALVARNASGKLPVISLTAGRFEVPTLARGQ